jgi:hypothetical protein
MSAENTLGISSNQFFRSRRIAHMSLVVNQEHKDREEAGQSIEAIHRLNSGKVSDKWASYLKYYDQLFEKLRHEPIAMLEIGVQNGGSLETWSKFFTKAVHLIGCDINPKCTDLYYEDPRIQIVVGDVNAASTAQRILDISPDFDIVIDDGSHLSIDILKSFITYFPALKSGGIYIVEDAHCLYLKNYGGGILNESSAHQFFKKLCDVINFQFWNADLSLENYLSGYFGSGPLPNFISEGWIDSVEFRNSLIIIRKATAGGHQKLGDHIISGSIAAVESWGGRYGSR